MGFVFGLMLFLVGFFFWPIIAVLFLMAVVRTNEERWLIMLGFIGLYLLGFA